VAAAMASAVTGRPLPATLVVFGEVGLAGDLRRVTGMDRRLAEAARLGFTVAVVPVGCGAPPAGLRTVESATVNDALRAVLAITDSSEPVLQPNPYRHDGGWGRGLRAVDNDGL